jgi:hypothetical protein
MNAKEIFEKLVTRAWFSICGLSSRGRGKPGELIERLPAEEREELKNLKSKDIQVPDRGLAYIQGEYPENTTSVHKIFPSKKDDNESN